MKRKPPENSVNLWGCTPTWHQHFPGHRSRLPAAWASVLAGILSCASTDHQIHDVGGPIQTTGPHPTKAPASPAPSRQPERPTAPADSTSKTISAPDVRPEDSPRVPQEPYTDYPWGAVHSPLTASIVRRLQQLEADHPGLSRDRFIKVGDSITRSPKFLACLGGSPRINDPTLAATLDLLRASPIDLFQRESLSAENGWSAWQPLAGNPPPLLRELSTVRGRFALVMLGTNDIETSRVTTFARRWMRLIDSLLEQGLVPLVSTIPERRDRLESRLKVPRFNAAIRAIAQERRVPLIDLHHALSGLPGEGLTSDGIHPSVHSVGGLVKPCDFSPRGLRHGFNVRNLISLEALHRARSALNGELVEPAPLPGAGHSEAFPAPVRELPSVRVLELAPGGPTALRCSDEHSHSRRGSQAQSPSIALSIPLAEPTRLEILALSALDGRALDISLYSASADAPCTQTRRGFLRTAPLPKGTYSLLVAGPAGRALVALLRGRSGAS